MSTTPRMSELAKSNCPNWKGECDSDLGAACPAGMTCPLLAAGAKAKEDPDICSGCGNRKVMCLCGHEED